MDNYLGTILDGRYEMLEIIGTGGMAVVYKARDKKLNRLVAIKVLKDELLNDDELRHRFHTESEAVAVLNNPNIVNIFDVSSGKGIEYFVMELVDGITLKQYMEHRGVLPPSEALHYVSQILKALEHAHSRNVIHRDIKPQNIMIMRDATVKVTDFGIARISSKQKTLTQNAFGSVHYISPEQARGENTDGRSDIYSVGVMLYEMLTSKLPFEGESPVAVAIQHLNSKPVPIREMNPDIPEALEKITQKAMNSDIECRYKSAQEMLSDIEEFKKNPEMQVAIEAPQDKPLEEPTKKMKILAHGEGNGDEDMSASKNRSQKDPPAKKAWLPIFFAALTAVAFLAAALYAFISLFSAGMTENTNIEAPDLVGKNYEEIVNSLKSQEKYKNLTIIKKTEQYSNDYAAGVIIEQDKLAGMPIKSNATIKVVVSNGPKSATMEDVTGKDEISAKTDLNKYFESIGISGTIFKKKEEFSDEFAKGLIIRTEPAAGETIKSGDTIYLVESKGPDLKEIDMPDLSGLGLEAAKAKLIENKLVFGTTASEYSDQDKDTVIGQSVKAGDKVMQGSTINLVLSKGQQSENTANYTFDLPDEPQSFRVRITQDGKVIHNGLHYASEYSLTLPLTGKGTVTLIMYIDNDLYSSEEYTFE